jgi:dihydrofolate synthase/folylpolyglutamate synthase
LQFYEEFTNRFTKSGRKVTDLTRISTLLNAVGNPQDRLKFIHVAGTNGKGSCSEMLARTLTAAGYKTGLFTSPYIIRYNDRIRIDGEDIADEKLNALAAEIMPHAERLSELGFSQFEITQAMAFLYFAREKCDVVVLEAGVGGKLDSTNVIAPPLLCVICSVSLDHTAILGDTIEEIAEQKSGIIKQGSQAVLAPENEISVQKIMQSRADECGVKLVIPDIEKLKINRCTAFGTQFEYGGESYGTAMGGRHQIKNALTVIEGIKLLRENGFDIAKQAVDTGLNAQISGRIQVISRKPLVIVDGGHNPDGVKALAEALATLDCKKKIVIGMLGDKDSEAAAEYIAKSAERFICVDGFYARARDNKQLAEILRKHGANAEISEYGAIETVEREIETLKENEALIVSGSLYLASEICNKIK